MSSAWAQPLFLSDSREASAVSNFIPLTSQKVCLFTKSLANTTLSTSVGTKPYSSDSGLGNDR